jgi:hypothetical protein
MEQSGRAGKIGVEAVLLFASDKIAAHVLDQVISVSGGYARP